MTSLTDNIVELAAKRPPEDYSVEMYAAMRALGRLTPSERVAAFSFSCDVVEARTFARIAARQVGPSILTAIAAELEEMVP